MGNMPIDLNKVRKLGSTRSIGNRLGATQSDFNQTKGEELALRDLLQSSPTKKTSQAAQSRNNFSSKQSNKALFTQDQIGSGSRCLDSEQALSGPRSRPRTLSQLGFEQGEVADPLEKSGKLENGPEGHDTPESMQHYSKDDEQADMHSCSQGD